MLAMEVFSIGGLCAFAQNSSGDLPQSHSHVEVSACPRERFMGVPAYKIDARTCRTWLAFASEKGVYYAGYIKETGHFLHEPQQLVPDNAEMQIAEIVPVSFYYLCYDHDAGDGTNQCRNIIWPQPEIKEGTKRDGSMQIPDALVIADLSKETSADKTQYLAVNLVNPKSPKVRFHLRYRFLGSDNGARFEATPETRKTVSSIRLMYEAQ